MEEKEVLSGALAKAELGRVTARAALADLVAAADKLLKPGSLTTEDLDGNKYRFFPYGAINEFSAAVERARKVMKEEA